MDSQLSVASRTAGRATAVAGTSFTAHNRTLKLGFEAVGRDSAGGRSHHHSADGDGLL